MITARYSRLLAAVLLGTASLNAAAAPAALAATQNSDGIYAVNITTRQGDCDKAYHWTISVSGGRVSSAGDTPMNASGHINPHGNVHLTFKRFHHVAKVTGTLTTEAGLRHLALSDHGMLRFVAGSPAKLSSLEAKNDRGTFSRLG